MRMVHFFKYVVLTVAGVGLTLGASLHGAEYPQLAGKAAKNTANLVLDVALEQGGVLKGQLVNEQGAPIADARIAAGQGGHTVTTTHTDAKGWFVLSGLRGGVYHLETPMGEGVVRAWTEKTAPPSARSHMLMVADGEKVRGQGGVVRVLTHPLTIGAGIAAAIAIPIAVSQSRKKKEPPLPPGS